MKIVKTYSHLNGLEYLLVHKKNLWLEVLDVIGDIDATQCKTKVSKESRMKGGSEIQPHRHEPGISPKIVCERVDREPGDLLGDG